MCHYTAERRPPLPHTPKKFSSNLACVTEKSPVNVCDEWKQTTSRSASLTKNSPHRRCSLTSSVEVSARRSCGRLWKAAAGESQVHQLEAPPEMSTGRGQQLSLCDGPHGSSGSSRSSTMFVTVRPLPIAEKCVKTFRPYDFPSAMRAEGKP